MLDFPFWRYHAVLEAERRSRGRGEVEDKTIVPFRTDSIVHHRLICFPILLTLIVQIRTVEVAGAATARRRETKSVEDSLLC